jgi:hypothetical protein
MYTWDTFASKARTATHRGHLRMVAACARIKARSRKDVAVRHIMTFPEKPHVSSVLYMMGARMGASFTTSSEDGAALKIAWLDATWKPVENVVKGGINANCRDITKSSVNESFNEAFGYALGVDPATHCGQAVEKPEQNAAHSGVIVDCPRCPRAYHAYQRVIDNHVAHDSSMVEDIRVVVIGKQIPVVYLKRRPAKSRFSNINTEAELAPLDTLTVGEARRLLAMSRKLGIDYGEFDCLRDRATGLLYVVDANPTPWGPPNHIERTQGEAAMAAMTAAFRFEFLRR